MLEALVLHPLTERLGWVLVHSLWQGLALAVLLLVTSRLIAAHRSAWRYGLATAALAMWLLLPLFTWFQLSPASATVALPPTGAASTDVVAAGPPAAASLVIPDSDSAVAAISTAAPAAVGAPDLRGLLPYISVAWLASASVLLIRYLGGYVIVQRLRWSGTAVKSLEGSLGRLAARLGVTRHVRLAKSGRIDSPTALGWLRPVILLPASALSSLSTAQLELILAHELAHLRRNDYLVSLLQGLAEALLFYHPLTWWLSRMLNTEREHACDELALVATGAHGIELAETLAQLEGARPALQPALSATSNLKSRILRLLRPASGSAPARPALIPLAAVAVFSMWIAVAGQPQDPVTPRTVVIDAGHSLEFEGATAADLSESELVLAVARRVRDALEQHGVKVVMTRDGPQALAATLDDDLNARAAFTRENVDAFISLHAGAASSPATAGVRGYVAGGGEGTDLRLAETVVEQMVAATGATSQPVIEQQTFRLLNLINREVPAVMIEIGYLSNPREAELLVNSDYQQRLAAAIAVGILNHLETPDSTEPEFFTRVAHGSAIPVRQIPERGWPSFHAIADLVQAVPFTVSAPSWIPDNYGFATSVWIEEESSVTITYQAGRIGAGDGTEAPIYFSQSPSAAFERLHVASSARLENVTVNGEPAVFVAGSWSPGREPEWRADAGGLLAWSGNGMTYVLGTSNVPVAEARDTLLGSAASLIEIGAPTLSPLSGAAPASERTRHWVSVYGDIILGADLQLSGQGFLVAEERSSTGTRRMHVLLDGDSGEKWTSWKDGIIVDSDEVARDWLATIVSESVRQELQEIRDSGVLRASALAHQPDGTRVTIIAISEGMQFGMAGMNRMVFPAGPSPSALGFEFLTQAYSHGLVGQGLFELTLHHALPLVLPEAVDEALYAVAHVDDLSFRAVFREVLSTER